MKKAAEVIALAISALVPVAALAADGEDRWAAVRRATHPGCTDCVNTGIETSEAILKGAKTLLKDTRMTEQEFNAQKAQAKDQKLVQAIDNARSSMLSVLQVRNRQNQIILGHGRYIATGVVAADSCYAWTSAHVVTEPVREGKDSAGNDQYVADESKPALGNTVVFGRRGKNGMVDKYEGPDGQCHPRSKQARRIDRRATIYGQRSQA